MHNRKIMITPSWAFRTNDEQWFEPVLFVLLESIRVTGKLTEAAVVAGVSYRHAWNLLGRSAEMFGLPLVLMHKGKGTQLSALGEKVLWADQHIKARLGPQIDSIASEFNSQIQQILAGAHRVLQIHASHGYAISILAELPEKLEINLQYRNPGEALSALNKGECDIASFHFPTCSTLAHRVLKHYHSHLADQDHRLIRMVTRSEGLMMSPGFGAKVCDLKELVRSQARFISRDKQSGTRILFNLLLQQEGLSEQDVNSVAHQELTHSAVAAFVAAGMADVGFGVEAAARQFGLDFFELASEHYLLLYRPQNPDDGKIDQLIEMVRSETFTERVKGLPGYALDSPGEVTTFTKLLQSYD